MRARRSTWRDPRLAVGVLLVCLSVVLGAKLLGDADQTVEVLGAAGPLTAGQQLEPGDLVPVRVRFATAEDADRYLSADEDLATGTVLTRPVGVGEMVPRAALSTAPESALAELPVAVQSERVPAGVRAGSVVDVWIAPDPAATGDADAAAELVLEAVPVRSSSRPGGGSGGLRQVVVGVPQDQQALVARVVAAMDPDRVVVVLRHG